MEAPDDLIPDPQYEALGASQSGLSWETISAAKRAALGQPPTRKAASMLDRPRYGTEAPVVDTSRPFGAERPPAAMPTEIAAAQGVVTGLTGIEKEDGVSVTEPGEPEARAARRAGEGAGILAAGATLAPSAARLAAKGAAAAGEEMLRTASGGMRAQRGAIGDLSDRVESSLGNVLKDAPATLQTFKRLPQNRTSFPKAMIEQELRRADVTKAERDVLEPLLAAHEGDTISAKELQGKVEEATKDFALGREETLKYATYGLPQIGRSHGEFTNADLDALAKGASTNLYRLPAHMTVSDANHFGDPRLFGWTRSFEENGVKHVVEVQSDLVQNARPLKEGERPGLESELFVLSQKIDDLRKKVHADRPFTDTPANEINAYNAANKELYKEELKSQEIKIRLRRDDIATAAREAGVEPMFKTSDKRLIREELADSARKGEKSIRFATADTVAKVEGWPDAIHDMTVGRIAHEQGVEAAVKYRATAPRFSSEHQSIYDRYAGDITKFLKQQGGKEVTDSLGHTWIEVPVRPEMKTSQMFNIGAGAAVGAALATKGKDAMADTPPDDLIPDPSFALPLADLESEPGVSASDGDLRLQRKAAAAAGEGRPRSRTERFIEGAVVGIPEAAANAITSVPAKVAGNIVGLGAAATGLIGGKRPGELMEGVDPVAAKKVTEEAFTYSPRSESGKSIVGSRANPVNILGATVGKVGDLVGGGAAGVANIMGVPQAGQDMIEAGMKEAVGQGIGMLGVPRAKTKSVVGPAPTAGPTMSEEVQPRTAYESAEAKKLHESQVPTPRDLVRRKSQARGFITPAESGIKKTVSDVLHGDSAISQHNIGRSAEIALEDIGAPAEKFIPDVIIAEQRRLNNASYLEMVRRARGEKMAKQPQTFESEWPSLPADVKVASGLEKEAAEYKKTLKPLIEDMDVKIKRNSELYGGLSGARNLLNKELTRLEADFEPQKVLEDINTARENARKIYAREEATLLEQNTAAANRFLADQLENLFEEHFRGTPVYEDFVQARMRNAKLHLIEDARNPATKELDPNVIGAYDKKYPGRLTGGLKDIADFANTFGEKATKAGSSDAASLGRFDALAGATAVFTGHPTAGGFMAAARIGSPWMARRGMFSASSKLDSEKGFVKKTYEEAKQTAKYGMRGMTTAPEAAEKATEGRKAKKQYPMSDAPTDLEPQ